MPVSLIVPTLCVGMHPVTLRVTSAQDLRLASTAKCGASPAAFPRRAWEWSDVRASFEETGAHGAGPERGHAEPGRGTDRKGQEPLVTWDFSKWPAVRAEPPAAVTAKTDMPPI